MARAARQLELAGVFASSITPRRRNSSDPDFSGLLDLVDFLAQGGVKGICLFGAAGEFLDYSIAERQRMLYLAVKRSRVPLIAGVSHSTLGGALQLADEAIAAGADGLLLMPPIFYPYTQCEIEEFFLQFARETGDAVPILLHNLPQCTSRIEPETVRKLATSGRFAGIKDSSGDWEYFTQLFGIRRQMPFAVMCGADRLLGRALTEGADGAISASACAVPELVAALAANPRNELLSARLAEFVEWVNRFPFPVAIKRAVELRGQKSAPALTPLAPGTAQLLAEFSTWFNAWVRLGEPKHA